jgi:hypothetical protein
MKKIITIKNKNTGKEITLAKKPIVKSNIRKTA